MNKTSRPQKSERPGVTSTEAFKSQTKAGKGNVGRVNSTRTGKHTSTAAEAPLSRAEVLRRRKAFLDYKAQAAAGKDPYAGRFFILEVPKRMRQQAAEAGVDAGAYAQQILNMFASGKLMTVIAKAAERQPENSGTVMQIEVCPGVFEFAQSRGVDAGALAEKTLEVIFPTKGGAN